MLEGRGWLDYQKVVILRILLIRSLILNQYVGKLKYNVCPGSNGNCYKWKGVDSIADGLLNWMKFDIHTKM